MITVYHNPRCRKSREAVALLQNSGHEFQILEYLKLPPTKKELAQVLKKLGLPPLDLIRKGETVFKEYKGKQFTDDQWIQIMVDHPILIERPLVIRDNRAIIGRPPTDILTLLD